MLEMKNVTISFEGRVILDHQSLIFPARGMIGIKGASGCGKSTLLYALCGLLACHEGEVLLDGQRMSLELMRRHIAFIKQNNDLLPALNVQENIQSGCVFSATAYQKIDYQRIVRMLGLAKLQHRTIDALSGGQIKRVAIARGLLKQSDILLCDEPTGCLHHAASMQVMEVLQDIAKSHLVIVVSHDALIDNYADQVLTLKDGVLSPVRAEQHEHYETKERRHKHYSYIRYAIKEVLYQKKKLLFLTLFQVIIIVAFFLMMSGLNGLHQAIVNSSAQAVMKNVMVVESRDSRKMTLSQQYHWRRMISYDGHLNPDVTAFFYTLPKDTSHVVLSSGRLPEKKHEVLISYALDEALHHPRSVVYEMDATYHLTVTGVLAPDFFMHRQLFFTTAFATAHEDYARDDCIEVESENFVHDMQVLSTAYDVSSDVHLAKESYQQVLDAGRVTAFAFLSVSAISSLVLMIVVFSAIYQERLRSYAIMMSLGAKTVHLMAMTLQEALVIAAAIVMTSLGVFALCYHTIISMTPLYQRFHFTLEMPFFMFPGDSLLVFCAFYMIFVMLISLIPFHDITRLSLVALLREDD